MIPLPAELPPEGSSERWPWLLQLKRQEAGAMDAWVEALESDLLPPSGDLLAVLAEKLDAAGSRRLLRWWLGQPAPTDGAGQARHLELLDLLARLRDPVCAALLREAYATRPDPALLPLVGHQRDPHDFTWLSPLARNPGPSARRRGALEALARGLSAWPQRELRGLLRELSTDLDGPMAAQAVDLLARLPAARGSLEAILRRPLDPGVADRVRRRLQGLPRGPMLLVVHGRAGGVIPAELRDLAAELQRRRRAPVLVQALSGESPVAGPGANQERGDPRLPLTLVPLFLLPGHHVRHDIPAIAAAWSRLGPLRRVPFLGAWRAWQEAIAAELRDLAARSGSTSPPLLLHHPLEPGLADRYLRHLSHRCSARCRATPYTASDLEDLTLTTLGAALPLALAANRLTESLPTVLGPPLLQRPRFQAVLVGQLEALP